MNWRFRIGLLLSLQLTVTALAAAFIFSKGSDLSARSERRATGVQRSGPERVELTRTGKEPENRKPL
jgi:hypothetical protein